VIINMTGFLLEELLSPPSMMKTHGKHHSITGTPYHMELKTNLNLKVGYPAGTKLQLRASTTNNCIWSKRFGKTA